MGAYIFESIVLIRKFVADRIETQLRRIEASDQATALTRPDRVLIPIAFRRYEQYVYNRSNATNATSFDRFTNQVVYLSILVLMLELLFTSASATLSFINLAILACFIFEFLVRWNYRRGRYFSTWGIKVDLPVIVVETVLLAAYFYYDFNVSSQQTLTFGGQIPAAAVLSENPFASGILGLVGGVWKVLRLSKLLRDVAHNGDVWRARGRAITAWAQATFTTLKIFLTIIVIMAILTRLFSNQSPDIILSHFVDNIMERLRANQTTGVENSDLLRAIYQVFTILSTMIIVTFFTQILLPIVNRIKTTQQEEIEMRGRMNHVILAVADSSALGLIEEVIQVWAIYEKRELVLLLDESIPEDEKFHPSYTPDTVRGPLLSRGSWLAVDASGADQIILLAGASLTPSKLSTFLPPLSKTLQDGNIIILRSDNTKAYEATVDQSGNSFSILNTTDLVEAIEPAVCSRASIQSCLIARLNEQFDKSTNILGTGNHLTTPDATEKDMIKLFRSADVKKLLGTPSSKKAAKIDFRNGTVTIDISGDPTESQEGEIIGLLRNYVDTSTTGNQILIFVESLHLVGVNAQLGEDSRLRIAPIELLVVYAAYHESMCKGAAQAWTLQSDALTTRNGVEVLDSPYRRTTYLNRQEVQANVTFSDNTNAIIGILDAEQGNRFKGFITSNLDTRRISRNDKVVRLT